MDQPLIHPLLPPAFQGLFQQSRDSEHRERRSRLPRTFLFEIILLIYDSGRITFITPSIVNTLAFSNSQANERTFTSNFRLSLGFIALGVAYNFGLSQQAARDRHSQEEIDRLRTAGRQGLYMFSSVGIFFGGYAAHR